MIKIQNQNNKPSEVLESALEIRGGDLGKAAIRDHEQKQMLFEMRKLENIAREVV